MPIEAKAVLLNRFEKTLSNILTANQMNDVMNALSDELVNYQVEQSGFQEGKDDYLDAFLSAKEMEGRSKKTIKHYRYIIEKFRDNINIPTRHVTVFTFANIYQSLKVAVYPIQHLKEYVRCFLRILIGFKRKT